jgi:SWI/SNF-related matrix-associated actin-dependent regulator 1 of chromatin subfamily A
LKELQFAKVAFPADVIDQLPGKSMIRRDGVMDDHFNLSGKIKVLDKLLRRFSSEDARVLIFSYSTQTLDFIQNYIRSSGYNFLRMDGGTATKDRQKLADQFKKDESIMIFLLSTKAMGLGLNLVEANKVIIFDVEVRCKAWHQKVSSSL